jgi:hypothetical protein
MPFPRIRSSLALAVFALASSLANASDGAPATPTSSAPKSQPVQSGDPVLATAIPDGFYLVEDTPTVGHPEVGYRARASDKSFRDLVTRWGADTGWQVAWELDADYSFSYASDFGHDFLRAVDGVCGSLNSLGVRARALAYPDNKVLRIVLEGTPR